MTRVLYKKTGKTPQIKYIKDMLPIKKLIVNGDLEIVKFENCIIVCNNKKKVKNKIPNIVLDFRHIAGDFFLIGYDHKAKDFKELDIEKTIFYIDRLQSRAFKQNIYNEWLEKSANNNLIDFSNYQGFQKDLIFKKDKTLEMDEENQDTSSPPDTKILEMLLAIQANILKYIKNVN